MINHQTHLAPSAASQAWDIGGAGVAFEVVDLRSVSLNIQPLLLPLLPTLPIKDLLSRV